MELFDNTQIALSAESGEAKPQKWGKEESMLNTGTEVPVRSMKTPSTVREAEVAARKLAFLMHDFSDPLSVLLAFAMLKFPAAIIKEVPVIERAAEQSEFAAIEELLTWYQRRATNLENYTWEFYGIPNLFEARYLKIYKLKPLESVSIEA